MSVPKKVSSLFTKELARRGVPRPRMLENGCFLLEIGGMQLNVSLENLARDYARDGDPGRIARFVDTVLATSEPPVSWDGAKSGVRFAAERSDQEFGDTVFERITETLCRVLAHVDAEETRVTWVSASTLAEWGCGLAEAERVAAANMADLLAETPIEITQIEQYRLGMLSTHSVLKASLVFSPNLKEILRPTLGWPIYAVIPCRDFAYVFAESDRELIPRLGRVVVREYCQSPYPISTEVFCISDEGIEAIGRFPVDTEQG
jgi:hypothetical protein